MIINEKIGFIENDKNKNSCVSVLRILNNDRAKFSHVYIFDFISATPEFYFCDYYRYVAFEVYNLKF
jgi:hypothetical protein